MDLTFVEINFDEFMKYMSVYNVTFKKFTSNEEKIDTEYLVVYWYDMLTPENKINEIYKHTKININDAKTFKFSDKIVFLYNKPQCIAELDQQNKNQYYCINILLLLSIIITFIFLYY